MSLLDDIQSKIYELTKEERARLREWFDEFDGDSWDKDFDEFVRSRKIEKEAVNAKQEHSDGKSKEL
ncbi:MAG: hypothetical protein ACOYNS_04290 [Bacteroidota bacterium]